MTDAEKLIEKVVAETGRKPKEIRDKMNERKEKTHGLLSDYGAIYAVAKEYGVDLTEGELVITELAKMKPSSSANIAGRVRMVYSEREFSRKDGSKGKFASVIIVDGSGETRLVLWDQNTAVITKLRVGDTVLVKNAYVKDNRGQMEAHAGALTSITVNPTNIQAKLPEIAERIDAIGKLTAGLPSVNVVCRVSSYFPKTEFQRSDGTKGSRASFMGEDESGTIRVVLWSPLAEVELNEGDIVKIENGYTREGLNGVVELQAGSKSRIVKTDAKLKLKPLTEKREGSVKVSEIKPDMKSITLEARVMQVYQPREYSKGMMASLILGDSTGTIRVVLWDEKAKVASELKEGDSVRLKNAYSRANMNQEPEVHVGKYSQVSVDSGIKVPTAGEINEIMTEEKSINDLDQSDRFVRIKGKIVQVEDRPLIYMTCPECGKKVQNLGGEWMCEEDGLVEGLPNMIASIIVEDKTGNIRAIAFKDKAERILGMDLEEAMNLMGETQDEAAPLAQAKTKIVGKEIALLGRVSYNEYSDQLEFIVSETA
jgi:replication factor A1